MNNEITLLDYYAARMASALISERILKHEACIKMAFDLAEAMLEERKKRCKHNFGPVVGSSIDQACTICGTRISETQR